MGDFGPKGESGVYNYTNIIPGDRGEPGIPGEDGYPCEGMDRDFTPEEIISFTRGITGEIVSQ
ncbi:unnamed protein product [Trichobilharzia regenti]|nr:unnamed protein product [Trichobilharzia regenti]